MAVFVMRSLIDAPAQAVFDWHEESGAFKRLTPPWEHVRILRHVGGIRNGAEIWLLVGLMPLALRWDLRHTEYVYGKQFCDQQVQGPFKEWRHLHRMIPTDHNRCYLEDHITYVLPGGMAGRWLGEPWIRRKLRRLFAYRHQVTQEAFSSSGSPQ